VWRLVPFERASETRRGCSDLQYLEKSAADQVRSLLPQVSGSELVDVLATEHGTASIAFDRERSPAAGNRQPERLLNKVRRQG
jgi:hypothetical protein